MSGNFDLGWGPHTGDQPNYLLAQAMQHRLDSAVRCLSSGEDAAVYEREGKQYRIPLFLCMAPEGKEMPKLVSKHPFRVVFEGIVFKKRTPQGLDGFIFMLATPTAEKQTRLYELAFTMPMDAQALLLAVESGAMAVVHANDEGIMTPEDDTPIFEIPSDVLRRCLDAFIAEVGNRT